MMPMMNVEYKRKQKREALRQLIPETLATFFYFDVYGCHCLVLMSMVATV